jgi:SSS family solute:Na+ symporter
MTRQRSRSRTSPSRGVREPDRAEADGMTAFTLLDLVVLCTYLLGVTAWGAWLGRGQKGGTDYFLGNRSLPWLAVMLSVVATETSTLTFLSVPGVAYTGSLVFLQLTFGYLLGRLAVSVVLLPAYYAGSLTTAYQLLERRFGLGVRRFTSGIFMVTRLLADSVRLFATAIPLAIITGWPYPVSITVIGLLSLIYTYVGGIKAVVWVDAVQMGLYLLGALAAVVAIQALVPGGWPSVLERAADAGKLRVIDTSFDLGITYTLWAGIFGGAIFTMASHGTDQLIVQRLLTCRDPGQAQKAIVGSGVAVVAQFTLFLLVGLGLWAFYDGRTFASSDEIFARFIVEELPPGVTGLLIAGVFAAAMSSLSSSINSLASATAYDYWAPLAGARDDEGRILRAGKAFTLMWAGLLITGAILFIPLSQGTAAVEVALGIASLVYGGLLGAFALGVFTTRPGQGAAICGIAVGIGVVTLLRDQMAWPWYVLVGSSITFAVGSLIGLFAEPEA